MSDDLFQKLSEIQTLKLSSTESTGQSSKEEEVRRHLDEILSKLPTEFVLNELYGQAEEKTPFTIVALQECRRMNKLLLNIKITLNELDLALKGESSITIDVENLQNSLYHDRVPDTWTNVSFASTLSLGLWFKDLLLRYNQLDSWLADFQIPYTTWLGGLFNPQSFLTAIMQHTARKNQYPIDRMQLSVEVTKKSFHEIVQFPREGVYIHNVYIEGARWDVNNGYIIEEKPFELISQMPVICVKALLSDKNEFKDTYECPVYKTKLRSKDYVWSFNLSTKEKANKWILASVALLLQP